MRLPWSARSKGSKETARLRPACRRSRPGRRGPAAPAAPPASAARPIASKAWSNSPSALGQGDRRAQRQRLLAPLAAEVDGDDRIGAGEHQAEHDRLPDAAAADDHRALPRPHARGVQHGADARGHRAADQRGDLRRDAPDRSPRPRIPGPRSPRRTSRARGTRACRQRSKGAPAHACPGTATRAPTRTARSAGRARTRTARRSPPRPRRARPARSPRRRPRPRDRARAAAGPSSRRRARAGRSGRRRWRSAARGPGRRPGPAAPARPRAARRRVRGPAPS